MPHNKIMYENELDPEIAALLSAAATDAADSSESDDTNFADFNFDNPSSPQNFSFDQDEPEDALSSPGDVDLSIRAFKPITEFFSTTPNKVFDDPAYYKTALSGENESAQRLHAVLTKYLTCQDPKDRTVFRQQMVTAYWEFLRSLAPKMGNLGIPMCKRMLMRFGVVLPSLFTTEQKETFASVFIDNNTGEPVYYLDEWFREIISGRLSLSATDEARPARKNSGNPAEENAHLMQLKSKNSGKLQSAR